jgi:hypothetical protein
VIRADGSLAIDPTGLPVKRNDSLYRKELPSTLSGDSRLKEQVALPAPEGEDEDIHDADVVDEEPRQIYGAFTEAVKVPPVIGSVLEVQIGDDRTLVYVGRVTSADDYRVVCEVPEGAFTAIDWSWTLSSGVHGPRISCNKLSFSPPLSGRGC